MFSFGIVLCEVGSSPLPTCSKLQAGGLPGPQAREAVGTGCPPPPASPWSDGCQTHPQTRPGGTQPQGPPGNCQASSGQIIGRVNADPDYLPRTMDFGLNVRGFLDRYCPPNCPPSFFPITVRCCDLDPEKR